MKKLWTIISVLAAANLIAMAAFAGWLVQTDRLNMDRIRALRVTLAKTITQEKVDEEAVKAKLAADEKTAEQARVAAKPPLTAAERLSARLEATELDSQRALRLKREVADLQKSLTSEQTKLASDREKLDADQAAFKQLVADTTSGAIDAQFQKTLKVMQSLKPSLAVTMLKQMITDGAPPATPAGGLAANGEPTTTAPAATNPGMTRVVSYLDAMDEKHRTAVMGELAKADAKLAAELLERIRKQGEFARVP